MEDWKEEGLGFIITMNLESVCQNLDFREYRVSSMGIGKIGLRIIHVV